MKTSLKTEDEIKPYVKANQLVGATIAEVGRHIRPGVTTLQLNRIAEQYTRDYEAEPTCKNFPIHTEVLFMTPFTYLVTRLLIMELDEVA